MNVSKVSNVSFTGVYQVDDSQFKGLQEKDVAKEILQTPPYNNMRNTHPFSYNMPIYRNNSFQPSSWVTEWYVANGKDGKFLKQLQETIDYVGKKGSAKMGVFTELFTERAIAQYHMACTAMVERFISKLPKR